MYGGKDGKKGEAPKYYSLNYETVKKLLPELVVG